MLSLVALTTVTGFVGVAAICAALVVLTLALLSAAKHAGALAGRAAREAPPCVQATSEVLARLMLDARGVLGVERIAVVLHDQDSPGTGVIEACCGLPGLVGSRVPVGRGFGWGPGPESRFLLDGPGRWSVLSVPIDGRDGIAGIVTVATRRTRGLSAVDAELLARLSRRATPLAEDMRPEHERRAERQRKHAV